MRSGPMPSPPGLPEFDLPMIFGDAMAGLGFQSGVARLAFAAMDKATLDKAMADPKGLLTTVLTNHVVAGRLAPDQVAGEHETLAGTKITVEGSGEDFSVGDAKVVCGNVQTANATVYIIDGVLLPAAN